MRSWSEHRQSFYAVAMSADYRRADSDPEIFSGPAVRSPKRAAGSITQAAKMFVSICFLETMHLILWKQL